MKRNVRDRTSQRAVVFGLVAVLSGCQPISVARANDDDGPTPKRIVGWVERMTMVPFGAPVYAKLDTGAKTSSIHAEEIERFERDGDEWVRFTLVLEGPKDVVRRKRLERPLYRDVRIKDHDDPSDRRPVVELDFCFDGKPERAQFSLSDRTGFIYSALLGRRFLASRFVVDPSETFTADRACPAAAPEEAGSEE